MSEKGELSRKKVVLMTIIVIAIMASMIGVGTLAYFSASQVSGVNNFATGSISFSVDGLDPWQGNFNASLADVKPGMTGWGNLTILNTGENPADLWMMITNVTTYSGGTNAAKTADSLYPHTEIDNVTHYAVFNSTSASPLPPMYVSNLTYSISDNTIGNFNSISGYSQARDYWIYLGVIQPTIPVYVNQSYTLDPRVTNWAQKTNMTFTVNFYAQQSQGSPRPGAPTTELSGHTRI